MPHVKAEPSTGPEIPCDGNVKSEPLDTSYVLQAPSQNAISSDSETKVYTTPPQPNSDDDSSDSAPKQTNYLERLCNGDTLDSLEAGVLIATRLLEQLRDVLGTYKNRDVDNWIKAIVDLEKRTTPTRTVVGVVGNTGAGKSSVINALLDEERLLPTNCLRACTASPTEISFNYSDVPHELYRAEIEFITAEEWTRELQTLFSDLLDGSGQICREANNADSDAGIAYAKVKAVYPQKTKEMLAQSNAESLAKEPAVRGILGTTKLLNEGTAKLLYQKLQHYVDSKEKSTGSVDHRKRVDVPMEYWPLIKVVRIFTKANALSTGAVIVDLPGVQDSNQARAAVAANYMKSCTGLWIVAPITRAVDDKTAKSLLGDSFKRQLKYDGTYSAVSFICSKTDDISITEAAESLGLEAETSDSWDAAEEMKNTQQTLRTQISDLRKAKQALGQQLDECETKTDAWEDLQSRISSGETVYEPATNTKKRKRGGAPSGSRKRLGSHTESDGVSSDDDSSDKENSQPGQDRKPLTEEEVEEQILLLRTRRKEIRGERRSLDSQIAELRKEIEGIENEREKILADVKAICIQGRNDYSRGAIKQDFAMGIKELDQENAIEEDDATFDPDQDVRDYDEVARSLPVFCVSSRAYQKLSGRLEKDDIRSHGFLSLEDTEIPQLQEHAKKLTEGGRRSHCRRFLNDLSQLVNSMSLWSADDGTGLNLTDGEKRREERHLKKLLDRLSEALDSSLTQSTTLIKKSLEEHIFESVDRSISLAVEAAPATAYSWGAPRSEGGLFWATYKATVRRQGVYSGASGPRDFNQDLFEPISRSLATGWERAFQRRLPAILEDFANQTATHLNQFHHSAKARAEQRHTNAAGLMTLSSQIMAHIRVMKTLPAAMRQEITEAQREASRQFTPAICRAMNDAYTICTNERGAGSYARMKDAMINHVDTIRHSMFREAINAVKGQLAVMCRTVEEDIDSFIQAVFDTIYTEYMRTLVGAQIDRSKKLSRKELEMRHRVNRILLRADKLFDPMTDEAASEMNTPMDTDGGMEEKVIIHDAKAMEDKPIVDDAEAHTHSSRAAGDEDLVHQADELIQAHIREQSQVRQVEEDDPFATDDDDEEFPDVMDLFKKEPGT